MSLKDVVADNFKVLRAEKDKTQRQAADEIGVAVRVLQNWESGTSIPELAAFEKAAEYYGKPVSWFYENHRAEASASEESPENLMLKAAKLYLEASGYVVIGREELQQLKEWQTLQDKMSSLTISLLGKKGNMISDGLTSPLDNQGSMREKLKNP